MSNPKEKEKREAPNTRHNGLRHFLLVSFLLLGFGLAGLTEMYMFWLLLKMLMVHARVFIISNPFLHQTKSHHVIPRDFRGGNQRAP